MSQARAERATRAWRDAWTGAWIARSVASHLAVFCIGLVAGIVVVTL